MAVVTTFAAFFGGIIPAEPSLSGAVTNKLSVDYEGDWRFIDGVESGGFRFGPQRTFRGTAPVAPDNGVRVRRCNPTQTEIAVAAASGGFEQDDSVFTIWAQTLMDDEQVIEPKKGDFLVLEDDWRIITVKRTMDYSQWRCLCRKSVK